MKITIRKASSTVKAGDAAYFLVFILLFTCDFYNTTTFKGLVDITFLLNAARVLSVILITVKCVYIDSYSIKHLIVITLLVGVAAISVFSSNTAALLDFILLAVGCRGIDDKKIVKTYFVFGTIYLLITMVCSLTGVIENYSTIRATTGTLRYSFGIVYSTDFAAHVFFLILAFHYIRDRRIKLLDIIIHILIVAFLNRYCDSRLSEAMILMTLILFIIYDFRGEIFGSRVFGFISTWVTVGCGIFSVVITNLYSGSSVAWVAIDELLFSNRLKIGKKVIDMYGFTPFGQFIKMQGMGYKVYDYDTSIGTTYIDSSYLQIILIYGTVFFVIMMAAYTYCAKKVYWSGNRKLSIILVLIAVSCIINQYLTNIAYNPFVVIFGTYLLSNRSFNSAEVGRRKIVLK